MKIITAQQASQIRGNGPTLHTERFDQGKYKGKPSDYVGRQVRRINDVVAVYPQAKRDAHGPFVALMCLCES